MPRSEQHSGKRKSLSMLVAAVVMLALGLLWSLAMFALFYYLIDVRGWSRWSLPFQVIGINSITIYMAQKVISFSHINKFFLGGVANTLPEEWGTLLLKAGYVAVCWLFLYFLYRKRIFLKV